MLERDLILASHYQSSDQQFLRQLDAFLMFPNWIQIHALQLRHVI
jgi:hypothetical protein